MAKLFAAAGQAAPEVKYIFELNPEHALVKRASDVGDNEQFAEWIDLLLDQACWQSVGRWKIQTSLSRRMNKLLFRLISKIRPRP
ncbi:High temperature protein G [Serratia fonticola]|uniref:High temperature protein G n=1 Tax=Serratia fonticola TaxID=47917 RepID=A0A4U9VCD1_SERFO|nr:High temperature protein G [Serratia fonticola]